MGQNAQKVGYEVQYRQLDPMTGRTLINFNSLKAQYDEIGSLRVENVI